VRLVEDDVGHGVSTTNNEAWRSKRQECADAMWADRSGNTMI
jgi:hypothetical protein